MVYGNTRNLIIFCIWRYNKNLIFIFFVRVVIAIKLWKSLLSISNLNKRFRQKINIKKHLGQHKTNFKRLNIIKKILFLNFTRYSCFEDNGCPITVCMNECVKILKYDWADFITTIRNHNIHCGVKLYLHTRKHNKQ